MTRLLKSLLVTLTLSVMIGASYATAIDVASYNGDWQYITQSDEEDRFLVDSTTVTRDDNVVSAKIKMIPSKLTQNQMASDKMGKADAIIMYTDFYCDKNRYLELFIWVYQDKTLLSKGMMLDPARELNKNMPNEAIHKYICAKY